MQNILIALIFIGALCYLTWIVKKQFGAKTSCPKGCGCSGLDLEKIEKEINAAKK